MSLRIYGNRLLKTSPGTDTRPTLAKVRQAVFNIWQGSISGCRWLDLCSGSGSMGAEALCRGASRVVGIEKWGKAYGVILENWQQVAQEDQEFRLLRGDVVIRIKSLTGEQFDRVYFDPPYESDLYQPVLEAIAQFELLSPKGEIAVEHNLERTFAPIPGLEICRQKVYGNTAVTFFCPSPSLAAVDP